MPDSKKQHSNANSKANENSKEKSRLHPRSKHRNRYDLKKLTERHDALGQFIKPNKYGDDSIDFSLPEAVTALNTAILKQDYGIEFWEIPTGYLCPPIPGRVDYIHHMADLLCSHNFGRMPSAEKIKCLDVGVGSSCIYPILGVESYGWSFVGADIDPTSIQSAEKIVLKNPALHGKVELRLQPSAKDYFYGVIKKEDRVDLSICNPPFHASAEDALKGSTRKVKNLSKEKTETTVLNFGGQSNELWCDGGEKKFVREMARESKKFAENCFWFSTLISKQTHLKSVYATLKELQAVEVVTIPMGQGNKTSRIVAWTFLTKAQQKEWKSSRWSEKTEENTSV